MTSWMDSKFNFCEMIAHSILFVNNIYIRVRELHPLHTYRDNLSSNMLLKRQIVQNKFISYSAKPLISYFNNALTTYPVPQVLVPVA